MNRELPPFVSVIMAVYNGETNLRETVSSMLEQTFTDFEFIIVNDGSTDDTEHILARLTDPRIIVIHNEQNSGLAYSLNRGLERAQGKYIARIDADDLAVPERLEKQVAFLERHSEIGIVGNCCVVIDETGKRLGVARFPLKDLEIRWVSLLTNSFNHPSVMIRRDIFRQHRLTYDPTFQASQDYELWTRMLAYTRGANLEELLTIYRISNDSITTKHRSIQFRNQDVVILRTIRQQLPGFAISAEQVTQLRESFIGSIRPKREFETQRIMLAGLYLDLLAAFVKKYSDHPEMKVLKQRESLKIACMVLQLRYFSYWFPVLKKAVCLSPGIVYPLLQEIVKNVRRSITRFLRRGYRFLQKRSVL